MQQTRDREALTKSLNRPRSTQPQSDNEMLITERNRIDHSNSIADSVLETAYATRSEFGRQTQTLTRLNQRLMQSASNPLSLQS
jgi:Golgi SNAP receptor complex protein 1